VKTYFMNDPQFKEFFDDEFANEQLQTAWYTLMIYRTVEPQATRPHRNISELL
jgi:hypothetical protein